MNVAAALICVAAKVTLIARPSADLALGQTTFESPRVDLWLLVLP